MKEIDGHVYTMEENIDVRPVQRRRHSAEFKAQAVKASMQPGVSIGRSPSIQLKRLLCTTTTTAIMIRIEGNT